LLHCMSWHKFSFVLVCEQLYFINFKFDLKSNEFAIYNFLKK
jgi:hypothetical protein